MGDSDDFKIPQKRIDEAKSTFKLYDKKDDGLVATTQFNDLFKTMGAHLKPEQLEGWSEEVDNGEGFFDFEAFLPLFKRKLRLDEEEKELKEAFRILDKDNQGEIHTDELRWILKSLGDELGPEEIEDMINEVDADGSGWVDYDEFYNLMMGGED